jgi:hypothetical protein
MNSIYLNTSPNWKGILFVLHSLKSESYQDIDLRYPRIIQKIEKLMSDNNYELAIKFYDMSVTLFYDFDKGEAINTGYLYGRIYIRAANNDDYIVIHDYVSDSLKKLISNEGYDIISELE